jgi:YVTN family beta-propeller protein
VTPITTATNRAGKPIRIGEGPATIAIAITQDGRTAYVVSSTAGTVTPIATATNTPGKPITVGRGPFALVVGPDSHASGHH